MYSAERELRNISACDDVACSSFLRILDGYGRVCLSSTSAMASWDVVLPGFIKITSRSRDGVVQAWTSGNMRFKACSSARSRCIAC